MKPVLVIGNRNYSSWSLRPWLFLRHNGIEFDEIRLPLDTEDFRSRIGDFSPSGRVPVLTHGDLRIWESLAICEYAAETWPQAQGWPAHTAARAEARAICCEMHSGFAALRNEMPMNCRAVDRRIVPGENARKDIVRIVSIWNAARGRAGTSGPWLFGSFSIADAMFAPVAFRFRTYGVQPDGAAADWMGAILAHPAMVEWLEGARSESEVIPREEAG